MFEFAAYEARDRYQGGVGRRFRRLGLCSFTICVACTFDDSDVSRCELRVCSRLLTYSRVDSTFSLASAKRECSCLTTDFTGFVSLVDDCLESADSEVADVFSLAGAWPSSAAAMPGLLAIATPIPSATASPPTLPMNRP